MSFVATAVIGSAVVGAGASIYAAKQAAGAQQQGLSQASGQIQQGEQQALGALTQYVGPYAKFGQSLQPTLSSLLTPGPSQTETLSQLPGFQFARDMAAYGIGAGAGRTGISGTTAVEGGNLETALASQNWTNYINPLVQLYGQGQQAAGQIGQGAANIFGQGSQALAGLAVGQGNVQAGLYGTIGSQVGNAASSIGNLALLNKLTGGGLFGGLNSGQANQVGAI